MSKQILIIEDNPDGGAIIRDILVRLCGVAKEHITWVMTYAEGEAQISSGQYDAILLDHRMPRTAGGPVEPIGYGLIPFIRQHLPGAKIIGTSSHSVSALSGFQTPDFAVAKAQSFLEKNLPEIFR